MTQNNDYPTTEQIAGDYFGQRGVLLVFRCSRCVRAGRLDLRGIDKDQIVSMKIRYIGPAQARPEALYVENDPWCYRMIGSPFPENPRACLTYGYSRDRQGGLWAECYNHVCLKDPDIYSGGIRFEIEVPDIVAEKQPVWQVFCNGEEVLRETLSSPGIIVRTVNVREVSRELTAYLTDVRRQQRIVVTEISRICEKYRLNWYLICGGLIGTVRDRSMIPWDDDLDIAMPFADYKRFVAAVRLEWADGSMELILPDQYGSNVFLDQMTRIVYRREKIAGDPFDRLNKQGRQGLNHHLTVDLYILQNAYDNRLKHWFQTRTLLALYGLALGHRDQVDLGFDRQGERRRVLAARVLRKIGRRIPLSVVQRRYSAVMRRSTDTEGQYYFQANGYHACVPMRFDKAWFGKGLSKTVSGMNLRIPEQPEAFLRKMYGDYLTLPYFFDRHPAHWDGEEKRYFPG